MFFLQKHFCPAHDLRHQTMVNRLFGCSIYQQYTICQMLAFKTSTGNNNYFAAYFAPQKAASCTLVNSNALHINSYVCADLWPRLTRLEGTGPTNGMECSFLVCFTVRFCFLNQFIPLQLFCLMRFHILSFPRQ